jgi:hypothetical protein
MSFDCVEQTRNTCKVWNVKLTFLSAWCTTVLSDFHTQTGKLQFSTYATTPQDIQLWSTLAVPEVPVDIPSKLPSSTWECYSIKGNFPVSTLHTITYSSSQQNTFHKLTSANSFHVNILHDTEKSQNCTVNVNLTFQDPHVRVCMHVEHHSQKFILYI